MLDVRNSEDCALASYLMKSEAREGTFRSGLSKRTQVSLQKQVLTLDQ